MMTCECGYADECDGETAVFHPLQEGGLCATRPCRKHIASADCWCEPSVDYVDPDTGAKVFVHNQLQ